MSALVVIPARLASTRLPGKPLLKDTGKYLVQHVYERALGVRRAAEVVIATDDEAVLRAAGEFGGNAMLTSREHASGTDRVAEVARARSAEIVVNLQGDEPEFAPEDVDALLATMESEPRVEMGTLVFPRLSPEEQETASVVKAVVDAGGWATDFLRTPTLGAYRHLGIYAFRAPFLQRFQGLAPSARERERKLEQMRALDHGVRIRAVRARKASTGIDTPEDYAAFVRRRAAAGG
ncbi:MAG: 3-deoxy-manno-octulosonate cytidylyltransferase [Planctomycetota bacterium]